MTVVPVIDAGCGGRRSPELRLTRNGRLCQSAQITPPCHTRPSSIPEWRHLLPREGSRLKSTESEGGASVSDGSRRAALFFPKPDTGVFSGGGLKCSLFGFGSHYAAPAATWAVVLDKKLLQSWFLESGCHAQKDTRISANTWISDQKDGFWRRLDASSGRDFSFRWKPSSFPS